MAPVKKIFIVCGEASGDVNAANLIHALRTLLPALTVSGVGGCALRGTGADLFQEIGELSAIGLFDVLKKLPKFVALKSRILKEIETQRPDAIILVDFSGFNLRLAKSINKQIPVIYYTSPQIWASRFGRIKTIQRYINKMIVFFKFEEDLYKQYGVDAVWTGHPLLDAVKTTMPQKDFLRDCNVHEGARMIALLPGSRATEIKHNLPIMLEALKLIRKEMPDLQCVIAKPPNLEFRIYERLMSRSGLSERVIENKTHDCLAYADFALVASGSATLEATILKTPHAIIYKIGLLNYLLYRPQIKVPYIGMANILAQKAVVREFLQMEAKPRSIAQFSLALLKNAQSADALRAELGSIAVQLGEPGASARAAQVIFSYLSQL